MTVPCPDRLADLLDAYRAQDDLSFHVVSDTGLLLSRAFGIEYEVGAEVRAFYLGRGLDPSASHASGDWMLPLPACFVIGRDGRVAWSHVDADYTRRAEPADVLSVIRGLEGR